MTNETITEEIYYEVDQLPAKPSVFAGRTAMWIGVTAPVVALGYVMRSLAETSHSSQIWIIVGGVAAIAMLSAFWYQFKTLRNALSKLDFIGYGCAEDMDTISTVPLVIIISAIFIRWIAPADAYLFIFIFAYLAGIYIVLLTYNLGSIISEKFGGQLGKLGKLIKYAGIINILGAIISPFESFAESESQAALVMILSALVLIADFAVGIWASVVFDRLFVANYPTAAARNPRTGVSEES